MQQEIFYEMLYILCTFFTFALIFLCFLIYKLYEKNYFHSHLFKDLKGSLLNNTIDCNELNLYILNIKEKYKNFAFNKTNYGTAILKDNSAYNLKRPYLQGLSNNSNIYDCSLQVCKNAANQPFKYIIKYFNIPITEETIEILECMLNDYLSIVQGQELLIKERDSLIKDICNYIPYFIRVLNIKKVRKKLGFDDYKFTNMSFPEYIFRYVSAGGNSSMTAKVILDIDTIEEFILYLSNIVKFQKSSKFQRSLMTKSLREKIKERDNYTCKSCGISVYKEPHLLLEVDHIIPIAKGGITIEENLQTLCWKCNRDKGSKVIS